MSEVTRQLNHQQIGLLSSEIRHVIAQHRPVANAGEVYAALLICTTAFIQTGVLTETQAAEITLRVVHASTKTAGTN